MSGGGAEREGDTECKAGSRLWTVSTEPNAGLQPTYWEIMTWAEVGCLTDWATQVSQFLFIFERERERERQRERERAWAKEGQRERGRGRYRTWSRLQALSCHHRAWRGARTHKPWDHDLSWSQRLNRLNHPGSLNFLFLMNSFLCISFWDISDFTICFLHYSQ